MWCTALMTATVIGRLDATKMRKMAVRLSTPNQRMAIGIQASGEIGRKIWMSGFTAFSARFHQPSARPTGSATTTAARYPTATRSSDAVMCSNRPPSIAISPSALNTATGPGTMVPGATATAAPHATRNPAMPMTGRSRSTSLPCIAPAHRLQPFEKPHGAVEHQSDHPDDDHARDDKIVAVAGVARVDDQVAESRAERDHLCRDDDQPGHAEADPHAHDDLGQDGGHDHLEEQLRARDAEVLGREQIALLDGVHARGRLDDHREDGRDE